MSFNPDNLQSLSPEERIRSFDEMCTIARQLGRAGLHVLLVQGVFDIVHAGHAGLLQATRRLDPPNSVVVVGLENDETVRRNKGSKRPVNPLRDRLQVVGELRSVTFAFGYEDVPRYDHPEDYLDRWRALSPDAVVAATWDPQRDLKEWQARETGTQIALVDYQHENSTTRMLRMVGYEE
jgi:cytidyltransferase-like protein